MRQDARRRGAVPAAVVSKTSKQPQSEVWVEEIGMRLSPATAHLREVVLNLERSWIERERRKSAGGPVKRS
jgi:hypothetical protein